MASLFNNRNKYYIAYHLNGKRITKCTYLEFSPVNRVKAEALKKEFELIEKDNKIKIKYGVIIPKNTNTKLTLADAAATYLKTIKKTTASGKRDNHSRIFENVIKQFQEDVKSDTEVTKINKSDIEAFILRKNKENANATVITYIRYLKGFFNYLIEEEYIDKSPIAKRHTPKAGTRQINTFKENDLEQILAQSELKNKEYFVIFKFLLLTGIRPGDIFEMRAGDFDLKSKILSLKVSKTQGCIEFPIYTELMKFIKKELPRIKTLGVDEKVFKQFNVERIGKTFRKILNELELKGSSYNLKTFRKTFATTFANKGLAEGDLADLLGHSSTTTTRTYYKSKNAGAIRSRMEALMK
ncbi:MAG TPA: tyrosine-type recombinase/integrase [Ignavibacteria bacterium]|nr:tyrosine-type recombinase/integrase [Ignavibacteria bacterium]HRJ99594.1 tyrosine-type recombinase/integrase [Ignavibacteria bacterium]